MTIAPSPTRAADGVVLPAPGTWEIDPGHAEVEAGGVLVSEEVDVDIVLESVLAPPAPSSLGSRPSSRPRPVRHPRAATNVCRVEGLVVVSGTGTAATGGVH